MLPELRVEITGYDGTHLYAVCACGEEDRGADVIAFRLERLDGERPGYRVARDRQGRWRCNCGDAVYRRAKKRAECKHVAKIRQLFALDEEDMAPKKNSSEAKPAAPAEPEQQPPPPAKPPWHAIREALRDPFHPDEIGWKPQAVKGNRAMAVAYVDARAVMDRLDDVVGPSGWQDAYLVQPDGSVTCRLSLLLAGEWVTKEDVGGQSEQPDGGDRRKAAFSDALKRAAVKFGVGRYLYNLPRQWCDYDDKRRCFVRTPSLPPWALPGANVPPPPPPPPEPPPQEEEQPKQQHPAAAAPQQHRNGAIQADETKEWLQKRDAALAAEGLSKPGELLAYVRAELQGKGAAWDEHGKKAARGFAAAFERLALVVAVERMIDRVDWQRADLLGQLGLPEDVTDLDTLGIGQLRDARKLLQEEEQRQISGG